MSFKLIIALDFDNQTDALKFVDKIDPNTCALKVGHEMFTRYGSDFVRQLVARQFKVFLDLKFYDIPNTVAQACKAAADLGVWMLNVHASGGLAMMQAAKTALNAYGSNKPLLIAVTVLTSFSEQDLLKTGLTHSLEKQVISLALLAKDAGLDGVVSSAQEARAIKNLCGSEFVVVTPGIRPENSEQNDQVRTMTPQSAINEGSDFLVIGRPVTKASDPAGVIQQIQHSIGI